MKTTEQRIEELQNELDKLKKDLETTNKKWKPEYKDDYWFVEDIGFVHNNKWRNDDFDDFRYSQRNCFKTEEEAQTHLKRLEIEAWLNDHTKEFDVNKYSTNYFLYYNHNFDEVIVDCFAYSQYNKWCMTEENCKKAIDKFGNDLKLVLTL